MAPLAKGIGGLLGTVLRTTEFGRRRFGVRMGSQTRDIARQTDLA